MKWISDFNLESSRLLNLTSTYFSNIISIYPAQAKAGGWASKSKWHNTESQILWKFNNLSFDVLTYIIDMMALEKVCINEDYILLPVTNNDLQVRNLFVLYS